MKWNVQLNEWGQPKVTLDGEPVAGIAAVNVTAHPGQPPALTLYPQADVEIEGEGVVSVVDHSGTKAAVLEFLATLDPESFEKKMLESAGGFGGPGTTGEMALAALRAEAETLT